VLILVRHGRTVANAEGRLQGRLDLPLDEFGRWQAARIGEALPEVARVVSSPLRRALETADAIGAPVKVDERWTELDYGEFDGLLVSEVGAEVWSKWRSDLTYAPPGGESLAHLAERVLESCEELLGEAVDHDIAIVSHVSPIKAAVAWALQVGAESTWRTHLDQASISRIASNGRHAVLRSFNETQHLRAVPVAEIHISG
jgi:broad specificity phosphatase PhoE